MKGEKRKVSEPVDHASDPKANYPRSEATRENNTPSLEGRGLGRVKEEAEEKLLLMKHLNDRVADIKAKANEEMICVLQPYNAMLEALQRDSAILEKEILSLMKKNKGVLFDGTDVVNLSHGSLIREKGEHVTIPKTALKACKENKFNDVIKVVESLDRDKIEKWPDAKLTLIGAVRKSVEEFKYSIRKI